MSQPIRAAPASSPTVPRTRDEIEQFLLARLSAVQASHVDGIDPETPLRDCLPDSSGIVNLTLDLIAWLNTDVPITLFWECPTVRRLADALADASLHTGGTSCGSMEGQGPDREARSMWMDRASGMRPNDGPA